MERKISLKDAGGDLNETIFYRLAFYGRLSFWLCFYDGNSARKVYDDSRAADLPARDVEIILGN